MELSTSLAYGANTVYFGGRAEKNTSQLTATQVFMVVLIAHGISICACTGSGVSIPKECIDAATVEERRAINAYISNFLAQGFSAATVQQGVDEACSKIIAGQ